MRTNLSPALIQRAEAEPGADRSIYWDIPSSARGRLTISANPKFDKIEDDNGAVMADHTLAYLRKVLNWEAARNDVFKSPIVRGMARTKPKDHARNRILSDDELRRVWQAAGDMKNAFGPFVRFTLLTAARRDEAANMRRSELDGDLWVIPAKRYKGKHDHAVPLSKAARAILQGVPAINGGDLVFTHDGERAIGGFSKFKHRLDQMSCVKGWTLHDLRRTARSLMSRAGVPSAALAMSSTACAASMTGTNTKPKRRRRLRSWPSKSRPSPVKRVP
jgi:integrase